MKDLWVFAIPVIFGGIGWRMRKSNPKPVLQQGVAFRRWRETPPWERLPRVVTCVGVAIAVVSWSIMVLLQGQATVQPSVATGIYQYPYSFKCHIRFLTEMQSRFEHADIGFAAGWLLGAVGGLSGVWLERRAARVAPIPPTPPA